MKTVKIVPNICKEPSSDWEGYVELRLPSFDERYEYIENLGLKILDGVELDTIPVGKQISAMREMVKLSKKHYINVDLKNKKTGEHIQSYDDMQYSDAMHVVLIQIASTICEGFKVGNV